MEENITFKILIDKLNEFQKKHPQLNSFGFGNLIEFGKDVKNTAPLYPLLFVVPQGITYEENSSVYSLQLFFADRLDNDNDGSVSIISNMSQISRDLISVFKLNKDFMYLGDFDFGLSASPFQERFNDVLAGISLTMNLRVSDYMDVCELNPLLGPVLNLNIKRSENPSSTSTYGGPVFVAQFPITGGTGQNIFASDWLPSDEYPKEVSYVVPLTADPQHYEYRILQIGNGNPYWGGELLNGSEPFSATTCDTAVNITFTGDNKTDWTYTTDIDYDCIGLADFKVITSDGIEDEGERVIEWRMEVGSYNYPSSGYIQISPTRVETYNFSQFFKDGDQVDVYIRDTRVGEGDTLAILEVDGVEVQNTSCFEEIITSFTLSGESEFIVRLQGKPDCGPIPSPTPTPSITPSLTPTITPTITPSPTASPIPPSPTPSATPPPLGPQPPSGMVHWYDFQDNSTLSVMSSGGTDYITGIDNKAPLYSGVYDLTNTIGGNTYPTLETNITGFTGHAHTGQTNGAQGAKFIDTATTADRRYLGVTGDTSHDYTGYTAVHIMKYHNPANKSIPVINHNLLSSTSSSLYNTRTYANTSGMFSFSYNYSSFSDAVLGASLNGDYYDIRNRYFADTIRYTQRLNLVEDIAPKYEHNNTYINHNNWRSMTGTTGTTKDTFTYGYQVYNNGSSISNFSDGDAIFLESIVYDRVLNDSDWDTLETYLDYKYGNPIDISEADGRASGYTENRIEFAGINYPIGFNSNTEIRQQLFGDIQIDEWANTSYANDDLRMIIPRWYDEIPPASAPVAVEMRMGNFDTGTYPGNRYLSGTTLGGGSEIYGFQCNGFSEAGTFYDWNNTSGRDGLSLFFDVMSDCVIPTYTQYVRYTGETGMVVRFEDMNNGNAEILTLSGSGVQTASFTGNSASNIGIYSTGGTINGNTQWYEYNLTSDCDPDIIDFQRNSNCGPTTSNSDDGGFCRRHDFYPVSSC